MKHRLNLLISDETGCIWNCWVCIMTQGSLRPNWAGGRAAGQPPWARQRLGRGWEKADNEMFPVKVGFLINCGQLINIWMSSWKTWSKLRSILHSRCPTISWDETATCVFLFICPQILNLLRQKWSMKRAFDKWKNCLFVKRWTVFWKELDCRKPKRNKHRWNGYPPG